MSHNIIPQKMMAGVELPTMKEMTMMFGKKLVAMRVVQVTVNGMMSMRLKKMTKPHSLFHYLLNLTINCPRKRDHEAMSLQPLNEH